MDDDDHHVDDDPGDGYDPWEDDLDDDDGDGGDDAPDADGRDDEDDEDEDSDEEDEDADEEDASYAPPTHVFFENEALIRALNDPGRSENDADAAQRLFKGLLEATLIALVPDEQELSVNDDGSLEGDLQIGFLTVRHADVKGEIIPMFTDEGALSDFTAGEGGRYVALSVRDLFPLLATGGDPPNLVINPGGREALLLTPTMVLDIVQAIQGYRPIAVHPGTDVQVSLPDDPLPDDARRAVSETMAAHEQVATCYEFQWHIEGVHDVPATVLAVEFDEGLDDETRRAIFEALQDAVEPVLADLEQPVDLVDYSRQQELFESLAEEADPVYRRG